MDQRQGVRVVLCAPGFPASADDPDKPFLLNHARALSAAGMRVTVVCPMVNGLPPRYQLEGIEVIRVRYAPRKLQTLAATGAMYREARGLKGLLVLPMLISMTVMMVRQLRQKNTVAYGHWWIPGGLVAVVAAAMTRRPSLVHLHGSDAAITATKMLRKTASTVMRMASVRLAVSAELAAWGERISDQKFSVLAMPIDFERLSRPSSAPRDGLTLGVGRLVPEKGFDLLIEAASLINKKIRPAITIVGTGPEQQRLEVLAQRLGVQLHLPGAIPPGEMVDWYQKARVVVVPSRREGFGMVAAEASACGRAVVAAEVGAMSQIVEHRVSGLLIETENVEALSAALTSVDPDWGSEGPQRVVEFGIDAHGQQVRQLCEDLLN
ncbi:MAG: hypothetical protein CL458_04360 [Acidimicrobiaceae bacterium]|nr:hypothetical protein [Acidimicrobiaceae bacterium]